ncbi:ATP-grasp fold amidoligase family protein [Vibrio rhodolitus]|uniref:ATP-grasp fold amidoligase family protein n=1 Tax=Vibrio rhodolitus TaxID=2231649 RepID=UPI000E0A7756|nr:ATP-grasp fold amidoligase family protein [Vibrio rhodolitus]
MRAVLKLFYKIKLVRVVYFYVKFLAKNGYIPNFYNPNTYNDKINYRKRKPKHELFSLCSDKILVKDYVSKVVGNEFLIENYFVGDSISPEEIIEILKEKGDCVLKANHNSGPVYIISRDCSDEYIAKACESVNLQLKVDFGKKNSEPWYSKIEPKILIERKLEPEAGDVDIKDYKFHVFKQENGLYKVILHVDFDRSTCHHRSFYDEELNYIPFSVEYPSILTKIDKPKNYETMLEVAKLLAEPFSYVRVDLYNVDGEIFFGELTFAHGSGQECFSHYMYDKWLGQCWKSDPSF